MLFFIIALAMVSFALAVDLLFVLRFVSDIVSSSYGAPYVSTPDDTAYKLLLLAEISPGDTVFDLGCGDGRLLYLAVKEFGAKEAVGYEISPWPYLKAKWRTRRYKKRITLYRKNLFKADLREATVVVVYLMKELLEKLRPKLEKELPAGTRIISVRFPIPGWQEKAKDTSTRIPVYLYKIPA